MFIRLSIKTEQKADDASVPDFNGFPAKTLRFILTQCDRNFDDAILGSNTCLNLLDRNTRVGN